MTEKDLDFIAGLEKSVEEKYGKEAIANPAATWSEEKEEAYVKQRQTRESEAIEHAEKEQIVEKDGFLVKKKLVNRATKRTCPVCITYSFSIRDDVYMGKFDCCYKCFVQHVEGREEKWREKQKGAE